MAYVSKRGDRFTAYYRDRSGRRRSAGTFDKEAEALRQAQIAEEHGLDGGYKASLTLEAYVEAWLPKADLMPITKKNYKSILETYVIPKMGKKKVNQIKRHQVRELLEALRQEGVGASTRMQVKASLGSAFKALVEEDQLEANPAHKIKIKRIDSNDLRHVLDPIEFKKIQKELPNDASKLFASFLVLSGCRFGEATELRVKDINFKSGEVYVQRRVSDLGAKHNDGERFKVIEATKSGHKRVVVVSKALLADMQKYVSFNSLTKNNLLFPACLIKPEVMVEVMSRNTSTTKTFTSGDRTYKHGTNYAYVHGLCRCEQCRDAVRKYRQSNRTKEAQAKAITNSSGHLARDTWRTIWVEAIAKSGIEWSPRTHDLRHANATALLKNGVDLHEVKERLGHQSIKTTERYLHRLRHQQSKAAEVVDDFRE